MNLRYSNNKSKQITFLHRFTLFYYTCISFVPRGGATGGSKGAAAPPIIFRKRKKRKKEEKRGKSRINEEKITQSKKLRKMTSMQQCSLQMGQN